MHLLPSGEMNLRVCASMIVMATIAVALRVTAKLKTKNGILLDDYLIFLGLSSFYVYEGLFLRSRSPTGFYSLHCLPSRSRRIGEKLWGHFLHLPNDPAPVAAVLQGSCIGNSKTTTTDADLEILVSLYRRVHLPFHHHHRQTLHLSLLPAHLLYPFVPEMDRVFGYRLYGVVVGKHFRRHLPMSTGCRWLELFASGQWAGKVYRFWNIDICHRVYECALGYFNSVSADIPGQETSNDKAEETHGGIRLLGRRIVSLSIDDHEAVRLLTRPVSVLPAWCACTGVLIQLHIYHVSRFLSINSLAVLMKVPVSLGAAMDWSNVELASAILCSCFPTYGPLIALKIRLPESLNRLYASLIRQRSRESKTSRYGSKENADRNLHSARYGQLDEYGADKVHLTTHITGSGKHLGRPDALPLDRINVRDTVDIA